MGWRRILTLAAVAGFLILLLALTPVTSGDPEQPPTCPPGALIVNATGTFICALRVEEFTPVFVSLHLAQAGGTANLTATCLTIGGCNLTVSAYDYRAGTLTLIGTAAVRLGQGERGILTYSCNGTCVFGLEVNGVWLGYYASPEIRVPGQIARELTALASRDPLLLAVAGLLVVSVPLGWVLSRELGATGIALAATSVLLYTLVYALTGSTAVAALVSALSGLIGVVYALVQGGSA